MLACESMSACEVMEKQQKNNDTPDEQTQLVLEQSPHDAKKEGGEHLAVILARTAILARSEKRQKST